ncbi:MAG TPA: amidohydrolase family protein [Ferruginibacter sp.]|nr:amidohydrolase family protein [Ferruginibacter sp.]HMP21331.1 amidohydrolase family protein [Ferruginibacter sp.]
MTRPKLTLLLAALLSICYQAQAQPTFPVNDVDNPKEGCYAFVNATIVKDAVTTVQNATMVIRKGKIESIGAGVALPKDAVVIDCKGKYIYPSFVDVYSDYGTEAAKPLQQGFGFRTYQVVSNTKGAYGWNQAIRSEVNTAAIFSVDEAKAKELRAAGIGTVLTHQMDGISRGTGAVVTLAGERENLVMLKEKASAHYSFNKGSSTQSYPSSLMGSIALLRQNFLDAQWYKTKPETEGANLSLQAFNNNLSLPQVFEATDKWNSLRADKIGDEFGVQYIIKGSGDEYQRISEIKATNASFIIPVNYPLAMDVEDPSDARYISLAAMKHWELAPTNAAALEKAGVGFAFTAFGLKDAGSFLTNIRKSVSAGLSEQKAIEALTKIPATLAGVFDKTGSIEVGKLANFLITSGPLFDEKTVIHQNWIQGNRYAVKDDNWKEIKGKYKLVVDKTEYVLEVKENNGKGALVILATDTAKTDVLFTDKLVKLNFAFKGNSAKGIMLTGIAGDDSWHGTGENNSGKWISWMATPIAPQQSSDSSRRKKKDADKILAEVVYPFTGYGTATPVKPETILIKNTTVWTSEKEGKLLNTDVLVKNGKIAAIGKNLSDAAATVIDGTGRHLTAGIIDEHSHIAIAGGVNECSQSVTSETRVADVLNPDDVSLYRHLSGGVTSTHLLHGSCNTIGGQTQLIKIRWGANAEQLKFTGWDPFIKFALGENVKRSSTQGNNRFPDTRMGVEQVLTDAFVKAVAYMKEGPGKRKDLKMEALVEILNKKRFITCHSYVQSEINMMLKVAEKFGFTLNTFTHILEGYKVADKMKAHGAAASTFSDWWTYKMEVLDAIPQNAYIMQQVGLNVAINSDDAEMATRLNQEAAKSVKYGGMDELEALKMVTINPAAMLHVADRTGSIKVGKDADLVLWTDEPLSIYAKAEKTIVDGAIYFDRQKDALLKESIAKEKARLVQKMISAKKSGDRTTPAIPTASEHNYCEDDNHGGTSIWERIEHRIGLTGE